MVFIDLLISLHLRHIIRQDILSKNAPCFSLPSKEAETLVDAAVTVNVMGEVAVIIPTISPNEGR